FCMKFFRWSVLCFVTFSVLIFPQQLTYSKAIQDMKVHFIDVGQGDSILIQTPNDKHILIDVGPPESGKRVVRYLKKLDVNTIQLMIATHPDIDHIGVASRGDETYTDERNIRFRKNTYDKDIWTLCKGNS